jgi:hypothetical protein
MRRREDSRDVPVDAHPPEGETPLNKVGVSQLGKRAVEIIQQIITSALKKARAGKADDLTKIEYDTVWKMIGMNPAFLKQKAFKDQCKVQADGADEPETDIADAESLVGKTPEELMAMERQRQANG